MEDTEFQCLCLEPLEKAGENLRALGRILKRAMAELSAFWSSVRYPELTPADIRRMHYTRRYENHTAFLRRTHHQRRRSKRNVPK